MFAALVGATAALSVVTVEYGAAFAGDARGGSIVLGPDVLAAAALGLAWGVVGGAVGALAMRRTDAVSEGPGERSTRTARTRAG